MSLSVRLIVDLIGVKNSEVPHPLCAEALGERGRVDNVAKQTRHLLHLAGKRADLPGPRNPRRRPHRRGAFPQARRIERLPHCPQNLYPTGLVAEHDGQTAASGAPHSPQNFMPGGLSAWHRVHLIWVRRGRPALDRDVYARPHSSFVARRAPSASAANLTQTTVGWTSQEVEKLAKPQSAPAITFSRPTTPAKRVIRCATVSGCSTRLEAWVITPGISSLLSGNFAVSQTRHSCS